MRLVLVSGLACLALLVLLSCQTTQPTSPAISDGAGYPIASSVARHTDGADLLAGFRIELDPGSLSATATPHRTTSAQPPQGQRYDLDIANFQNADSFRVTGVQVLGSGNFRITFTHAHPFPAPNIANPPTGSNRADLGYTGRLVILTSYNPNSFFTGVVRMSAGAVVAPDGYVEVGDLLANAGPSLVTAYPYKLLADEAQDNRTGISNGGDPDGSYLSSGGGWQRINLGASGTGWTGFDYIHSGQSITNQFVLSKEALAASNFTLDVALLIQYQDPRGAGGSTFRFPPTVIDPLQFAYRMPYAALDCSRAIPTLSATLSPKLGSSVTLEARVRDWDAAASEATDNTVGDETDVSLVQVGASGSPEVVLDAPGILAGLRNMGTPGGESGWSDDPLLYSNTLPNQEGATAGTYYACLRITDPEFEDAARSTYHAGVDATTLLPDATRAVPARTWQIVPITVGPDVPAITQVFPTGIIGGIEESVTFSASATNEPMSWNWNFGGGATPNTSTVASPEVRLASAIGTYTGTVIATNAGGDSTAFSFQFRVLENQQPTWTSYNLAQNITGVSDGGTAKNLMLLDGKPVLAMLPLWKNGPLQLAIAQVPNPLSPDDWQIHDVVSGAARFPALFTVNGKLAIAYLYDNDVTSNLSLALAQVAQPSSAADWNNIVAYVGAGEMEARCSGLEFRGHIVLVYEGFGATNQVGVVISDDLIPIAPSDFDRHELQPNAGYPSLTAVTGDTQERLMIVNVTYDSADVYLWQANPEIPTSAGQWNLMSTFDYDSNPEGTAIMPYERAPGQIGAFVSWTDPETRQPILAQTSGYSFMGRQSIANLSTLPGVGAQDDISLGMLNSRLVIAYPAGSGIGITRAFRQEPAAMDWGAASFLGPYPLITNAALVTGDNCFIATMLREEAGGYYYGISVSSGPW